MTTDLDKFVKNMAKVALQNFEDRTKMDAGKDSLVKKVSETKSMGSLVTAKENEFNITEYTNEVVVASHVPQKISVFHSNN